MCARGEGGGVKLGRFRPFWRKTPDNLKEFGVFRPPPNYTEFDPPPPNQSLNYRIQNSEFVGGTRSAANGSPLTPATGVKCLLSKKHDFGRFPATIFAFAALAAPRSTALCSRWHAQRSHMARLRLRGIHLLPTSSPQRILNSEFGT